MTTYKLNPQNARQAGVSTRITEKGAYIGKFIRAEAVTARSGAQGIEFTFETDAGQKADYLTLWTQGADGRELYGRKVLDALMTCLKVREISPENTPAKRQDGTTEVVPQFRALMGRIGLFLVREEYEKQDGSIGNKMVLLLPFCADTKQTANEVLDNKPSTDFDRIVANLRDKAAQPARAAARPSAATGASRFADMDDDIPF